MISKKKYIILVVTIVVFFGLFVGFQLRKPYEVKDKRGVVSVGLKPSQQEYFSKQLSSSFREVDLLKKGKVLIEQSRLDEAIVYFENLINDKSFEAKGLAREHLINAYEKKHEYNKAYSILYTDIQKYEIPPEHDFRIPKEERLKYLKYASEGEYELAVKHAQMALEANKKLPLKNLTEGYLERLNDLKAAKSYIESLKK